MRDRQTLTVSKGFCDSSKLTSQIPLIIVDQKTDKKGMSMLIFFLLTMFLFVSVGSNFNKGWLSDLILLLYSSVKSRITYMETRITC